MNGRKYHEAVPAICLFALVGLFGLFVVDETASRGLGQVFHRLYQNVGPNLEVAEGIRLYVDPSGPKPDDTDGRPDNRLDEDRSEFGDYPEIQQTRALVIVFGASWCQWCKAEGSALVEPSKAYNIVYADIENPDGTDSRWGALLERWNLGTSIPVTVVVVGGKVVKTFQGFTEWTTIQPFAEKAKKNEDESKEGFVVGPLDSGKFGNVDLGNQDRNRRRR